MKHKLTIIIFLFSIFIICSCDSKSSNQEEEGNETTNSYPSSENNDSGNSSDNSSREIEESNDDDSVEDETNEDLSGCKFEDGTHLATVDYSNSETGYSATYTLYVEVQDCQIIQINFPNDGYLDEDHIYATDLEEDGSATVDGEDGKTYEIQIDN